MAFDAKSALSVGFSSSSTVNTLASSSGGGDLVDGTVLAVTIVTRVLSSDTGVASSARGVHLATAAAREARLGSVERGVLARRARLALTFVG